ncbi:MAG TPA: hypothetical protein VG797_01815 [Phycisphaerales bacterium]|nr:hypothetical protein [Phycisphaerales bacterium]
MHDWQFWAVTAIFVLAAGWLLRGVLPIPVIRERLRRKKHERRASLTVEGRKLNK